MDFFSPSLSSFPSSSFLPTPSWVKHEEQNLLQSFEQIPLPSRPPQPQPQPHLPPQPLQQNMHSRPPQTTNLLPPILLPPKLQQNTQRRAATMASPTSSTMRTSSSVSAGVAAPPLLLKSNHISHYQSSESSGLLQDDEELEQSLLRLTDSDAIESHRKRQHHPNQQEEQQQFPYSRSASFACEPTDRRTNNHNTTQRIAIIKQLPPQTTAASSRFVQPQPSVNVSGIARTSRFLPLPSQVQPQQSSIRGGIATLQPHQQIRTSIQVPNHPSPQTFKTQKSAHVPKHVHIQTSIPGPLPPTINKSAGHNSHPTPSTLFPGQPSLAPKAQQQCLDPWPTSLSKQGGPEDRESRRMERKNRREQEQTFQQMEKLMMAQERQQKTNSTFPDSSTSETTTYVYPSNPSSATSAEFPTQPFNDESPPPKPRGRAPASRPPKILSHMGGIGGRYNTVNVGGQRISLYRMTLPSRQGGAGNSLSRSNAGRTSFIESKLDGSTKKTVTLSALGSRSRLLQPTPQHHSPVPEMSGDPAFDRNSSCVIQGLRDQLQSLTRVFKKVAYQNPNEEAEDEIMDSSPLVKDRDTKGAFLAKKSSGNASAVEKRGAKRIEDMYQPTPPPSKKKLGTKDKRSRKPSTPCHRSSIASESGDEDDYKENESQSPNSSLCSQEEEYPTFQNLLDEIDSTGTLSTRDSDLVPHTIKKASSEFWDFGNDELEPSPGFMKRRVLPPPPVFYHSVDTSDYLDDSEDANEEDSVKQDKEKELADEESLAEMLFPRKTVLTLDPDVDLSQIVLSQSQRKLRRSNSFISSPLRLPVGSPNSGYQPSPYLDLPSSSTNRSPLLDDSREEDDAASTTPVLGTNRDQSRSETDGDGEQLSLTPRQPETQKTQQSTSFSRTGSGLSMGPPPSPSVSSFDSSSPSSPLSLSLSVPTPQTPLTTGTSSIFQSPTVRLLQDPARLRQLLHSLKREVHNPKRKELEKHIKLYCHIHSCLQKQIPELTKQLGRSGSKKSSDV